MLFRSNKSDATNEANNVSNDNKPVNKSINDIKRVRLLTKKELFDELYEECKDKRKREKISFIVSFLYVLLNVGFRQPIICGLFLFFVDIGRGYVVYVFECAIKRRIVFKTVFIINFVRLRAA